MPESAPIAARTPIERSHHGDIVVDDYEWMRDKSAPQVIAHLEAENAWTDQHTAHLAPLSDLIFEEITSRTLETDLSVPVREGQWWYYSRTVEGSQYAIHCRAPIADSDDWTPPAIDVGDAASASTLPGEQILLDKNLEAEGHEFFSLGSFDVSGDGSLLLYGVDTVGDERYTVLLRDLATGLDLPDVVPNTSSGAIFDATGHYVFYATVDDAWRPDTIWRHEVGTLTSADVAVFHEPDDRFWVGIGLTRSRRFLEIQAASSVTSESRVLDANDPTGEFTIVWPRRDDIEYSIEHAIIGGEDTFLIVHNDGRLDFEVIAVPASAPGTVPIVIVPHREGTRIESVDAFAGHLVLEYRRDALPRLAIARLDAEATTAAAVGPSALDWHELRFDEELFAVGAAGNPDWNQPTIRYGYGSFATPSTVFDFDVSTGKSRMLKRQPVLGGFDPTEYDQRREWAVAADGTRIPISIVFKRDLVTPGTPAPLLLYGYGSYEHSIDPGFSIPRLSLLDRGVAFAVAHVRGGGELGRSWYESGKKLTKTNSFTDFVACAEHLTRENWTTPNQLVAEGRSAGGLLMGAVANIAPEAFAGILAGVPFVDPLTSILDPDLPLTVIEWDEWGDPLHGAEVYDFMKSYSPYENVRDVEYPPILAVTSLNDTRVLYVEPAKWVAKLREVGAPALLKTEMTAGHGGVSGRYAAWRERSFELAWIIDTLGLPTR